MIAIHKPADRRSAIKMYADVPSDTRPGTTYKVAFIRKPGMERWTCSCPDQVMMRTATGRHCKHIKAVRQQVDDNRNLKAWNEAA